ncbi:alpha/beta fold hydrolase [Altererythrobacter fulvus]|uniref:alpha/beta hydrolase n=1 Tax=Caenibius fulvus TaxID=2126012 RepID=UPI003016223E
MQAVFRRKVRLCAAAAVFLVAGAFPALCGAQAAGKGSIVLERQGGFAAGGTVLGDPAKSSLHCDHGYVEYQIPVKARKTALFMWHSSSALVWQQRWDGGEGFRDIFLKRGFPVYLWDGPRVGRANWGCEEYSYKPLVGRDQGNFTAWRFGKSFGEWFPGIQFPTQDKRAYDQAMRARYEEFDIVKNVRLEAAAGAKAIDEVGPSVVLTNSAGGLRALLAATQSGNVKAIVAYENPGFPFPEGAGPAGPEGPFGPIRVSEEEFDRLTKIPLQFVWGDNIADSATWPASLKQCEQFVELINRRGGKASILKLTDVGLKGNTHIPFMDMNNRAVADQLSAFLKQQGLDRR